MSAQIGSINVSLLLDSRGYAAGMTRAESVTSAMSNRIRRSVGAAAVDTSRRFSNMAAAVAVLHGPLGGVASRFTAFGQLLHRTNASIATGAVAMSALGFASFQFVKVADRARLMSNQLKTVTTDTGNLADIQNKLFSISQRTRSSLEGNVTVYSRIARATQAFGTSQEDLLRITETIQKAFAVGGATTAEAFGAAIQLSQGIASDRFSGEEFRSVAENAPVLLNAMARSLGVTIGKLREMAHAGQLNARVVTKAILESSSAIDSSFAKTQATVGQATTRLGNALLVYVGDVNETYGVTQNLAEGISFLADNFKTVADMALLAGGAIASIGAARLGAWATRGAAGGFGIRGAMASAAQRRNELIAQRASAQASLTSMRANIGQPMAELENKRLDKVNQALGIQRNIQGELNSIIKQREVLESAITRARTGGIASLQNSAGISDRVKKIAGDIAERENFISAAKLRQAEIQRTLNAGNFAGVRGLERQKKLIKESNDLAAATIRAQNAADTGRARLLAAMGDEHAKMSGRLSAAQRSLAESSAAVSRAQAMFGRGSPEERAARLTRAGDYLRMRAERTAVAGMTAEIAALGKQMTLTGAIATRFGAAMRSLWAFIGGPWGAVFAAAIGGWMLWSHHSAKAQKQTEDFMAKLRELGYVSEKVGASVGDGLDLAKAREDIRVANVEIGKLRDQLNAVNLDATRVQSQVPGGSQFTTGRLVDTGVTKQFEDIRRRIVEGKGSLEEFRAELGRLATENRGVDDIVLEFSKMAGVLLGAKRHVDDLRASFRGLLFDFSMFPGYESLKQILDQYTGFISKRDEAAGALNKINEEHEKEIELLKMGNKEREREKAYREALKKLQEGRAQPLPFETLEDAASRMADATVKAKAYGDAIDKAREDSKRFAEGMEKLRLEALAAPLDDFGRSVVSTAQSLGIATKEIEAFINAALSGNLDAIPEKFRKIGEAIRQSRLAELTRDIAFTLSQIGRTDDERDVATALRGVYGDDYINQMNSAVAAQMRLNQQLQFTHDIGKDAFTGILQDLREGVSLADALKNAAVRMLSRIEEKLAEIAFSNLWKSALGPLASGFSSLFGGTTGSMFGGITAPGGFWAGGGYTGSGGLYDPAGIVHKGEYVFSKKAVDSIGVGNLEKFHAAAKRGYLNGGLVGESRTSVAVARLARGAGAELSSNPQFVFAPVIHAEGADAAAVGRIEKTLREMNAQFETRAVKAVQSAKSRRVQV